MLEHRMGKATDTSDYTPYLQRMKAAGLRVTEQRRAVLRLLMQTETALSVTEAHSAINKKQKVADMASVYRIFEAFEKIELVHQVSHNSYVRCQHVDCSSEYHVLLNCQSCDRISEVHVPSSSIEPLIKYLRKKEKFKVLGHPLSLNGTCKHC